jgi:hypothetical protein
MLIPASDSFAEGARTGVPNARVEAPAATP